MTPDDAVAIGVPGTDAGAPAIVIEGARKTYAANRVAVTDVSLTVGRGSVHGLLGPNGAGKTTTLKMLLGLVSPSGGAFRLFGETAGPDVRHRIGFLPEQPYFPALLTAQQVMVFYARLSGLDKQAGKERAVELLPRVGLRGQENTPVSRFSRGMLQRLGIAQALVASPELLVFDEPASGLDPVGQRDVRNLILELRDAGTTVLLSSHQLSEVEAVCDEVTILDRGTVAARGRIDDLLNVAGQVSVTANSSEPSLPVALEDVVTDVAFGSGRWVFSIPSDSVRATIDVLDDAGWEIVSITPKRESLEDYFAQLLARPSAGEVA